MNSLQLTREQFAHAKPLPGRIVLRITEPPERIGLLFVPDSARKRDISDVAIEAEVIAVGYGEFYEHEGNKLKWRPGLRAEDVKPGDRVCFKALMQDLNREYLITSVTRVEGVIE